MDFRSGLVTGSIAGRMEKARGNISTDPAGRPPERGSVDARVGAWMDT